MNHMPENIANAVIPAGLNPEFLPALIGGLNAHNVTAISEIPGITPEIIQKGTFALLDTFVSAFRNVWITASAFVALAAIGMSFLSLPSEKH
jgi:hypothetical protein